MKRFISTLLVAVLVLTSLATVVYAAGTATVSVSSTTTEAGKRVNITYTVKDPAYVYDEETFTSQGGFANFELYVTYDKSVLTLVNVSDICNLETGKVAWASAENVGSHSFTATFQVAEGAEAGKYTVGANVDFVSDRSLVNLSVSTSGGIVTIEEPECEHEWDKGTVKTPATCGEDGEMLYTCSKCGETKTEVISATGNHTWSDWTTTKAATCTAAGEKTRTCSVCGKEEHESIPMIDHNFGWKYDDTHHWLICDVCGHTGDKEAHDHNIKGEDGYYYCECGHKGDKIPVKPPVDDPNLDDVPKTGDITMQVVMGGSAVVIAMLAAVAFVFKRKTAK